MSCNFHIIIPARYQSSRLPGKLLMDLQGQTVLERVYRKAQLAGASSVTIATDDEVILQAAQQFGASVLMTANTHQTGTDRIAEAVRALEFSSQDIVVNVQGDEPLIAPELITQVAQSLALSDAPVATLCWPIEEAAMCANPNVVKVVRDRNNNALYFSRSPIPANRDNPLAYRHMFRHIGLYAYRVEFLLNIVEHPACELETLEALEQLRMLWIGSKIRVDEACVRPLQDINTLEDLISARGVLQESLELL